MRIKSLAALGLCLLATACMRSWTPEYGPVPQTAAAHQGRTVRVVMKSGGAAVVMRNMWVQGDSMGGDVGNPPQRYAVATEDVAVISVSRVDPNSPVNSTLSTAALTVIALTLAALIALIQLINKIPD